MTEPPDMTSDVETLASVLVRALACLHSQLDFQVGLVDRLSESRLHEVDIEKAVLDMRMWRDEIERSWHEARIVAGERVGLTAALQRLTNGLGDWGSLAVIEAMGGATVRRGGDGAEFRQAAATLRGQLDGGV